MSDRNPGSRVETIDAFVKRMFDSGDPPSRIRQLCRWARQHGGEPHSPLVRGSWRAALWRAAVLQADADASAEANACAMDLLRDEVAHGREVTCCVAEDRMALRSLAGGPPPAYGRSARTR